MPTQPPSPATISQPPASQFVEVGQPRIACTIEQLRHTWSELQKHADALIVYFNRNCVGCQTAREMWASRGLLLCVNVYFVEFNEVTQDQLNHVTHLPSYEQVHHGQRTQWGTGLPPTLRTVSPSSSQVLICELVDGDVL